MKINMERLKKNIVEIGEIGKTKDGITRISFSKEYYEARDKLKSLMEEIGLIVFIDKVGNLFGRIEGNQNLPAIMLGSHLDTVKNGGLFDGNLGIIAALECVNTLIENNVTTHHPIEIVAFIGEEGSEIGGTFGSRAFTGRIPVNDEGLSVKLANYNITIKDIIGSKANFDEIKAFLELHIEQGGILYNKDKHIGIVNGIVGITRYKISIIGESNHAGTTPMDLRKDALVMASKLIVEIDNISKKMQQPFVATVGTLKVYPDSVNVIPGKVEIILEMRDLDDNNIHLVLDKIKDYANMQLNFKFNFEKNISKPPVKTSGNIIKIIEEVCISIGLEYEIMASGAGHDSMELAAKVPTGMIFVPSVNGISHSPEEFTSWQDIELGTNVLLDTLIRIDKE